MIDELLSKFSAKFKARVSEIFSCRTSSPVLKKWGSGPALHIQFLKLKKPSILRRKILFGHIIFPPCEHKMYDNVALKRALKPRQSLIYSTQNFRLHLSP